MEKYKLFTQTLYSFGNIDYSVLLNDCTGVEYMVLSKIDECTNKSGAGYTNVTILSEELHVSLPAVSRALKRLEEKKFIERNVDIFCRRNTRVKLTNTGKIELTKCQTNLDDFFTELFNDMDESEQNVMLDSVQKMYKKVYENLQKHKGDI